MFITLLSGTAAWLLGTKPGPRSSRADEVIE
jgi:hypothetical protein